MSTPNSTIKILKNIPLDNTYKHTIYFESLSAQTNYFTGKAKYNLNNYTYQRVQKNVCRVGVVADNLYDCNYMMFQNTGFGQKWFYAFITGIEYVNDNCSDIYFEIDVMQTWFFDYELGNQYVEREHSLTDNVGDNIVPEPVELGEYVMDNYETLLDLSDCCVIVGTIDNDTSLQFPIVGYMYDNIYSSCRLHNFTCDVTGYDALGNFISNHQNPDNEIKFMYIAPQALFTAITQGIIPNFKTSVVNTANGTTLDDEAVFNDSASSSGYTPENKKLYTYPYNFYSVDNSCGDNIVLRYEFFNNFTPSFNIKGTFVQPVKVTCYPAHYKGIANVDYKESVSIDNFPQASWSNDYYARWLAQDSVASALSMLGNVGIGAAVGGAVGAGASLASGLLSLGASAYKASLHADIVKGKTTSNVLIANSQLKFRGCRTHVTVDMCKCIDNFFTRYGYATNKIKQPNISSRPEWNYVKTCDCTIKGSVPANDMNKINSIYDKGITFWKIASHIGNYLLNNKPTN